MIWSYLVSSVFHFLASCSNLIRRSINGQPETAIPAAGIILISLSLLYPIGGWLADSYLGRYKMVRYSTWIMWISMIAITVWFTMSGYLITGYSSGHPVLNKVIYATLIILAVIGLGGFQANIVQLGIDQLVNASSIEITSFITSYAFTLFSSGVSFHLINNCYGMFGVTANTSTLLLPLYVAVCLTLAIILDFIFGSCLVRETVPVTTNSVTLIARVVKYVFVNRNRSLYETTDTLDIAKHTFGGAFENQHVEHVKTFLRMIVILAIGAVPASQIIVLSYAQTELELRFHDWSIYTCYEKLSISYSDYIFGTTIILLYELLISPIFGRCLPQVSSTSVYMIGIFLSLLRILTFLGIETGAFFEHSSSNSTAVGCIQDNNNMIEFSPLWVIVVGSLEGLYSLLLILSGYKFVWAQSPSSMKGLIVGIMYAFLGFNALLQTAISSPFLFIHVPWRELPLSCGIWYYMMQAAVVVAIFSLFALMVKKYKRSQQNDLRLNVVGDPENE